MLEFGSFRSILGFWGMSRDQDYPFSASNILGIICESWPAHAGGDTWGRGLGGKRLGR